MKLRPYQQEASDAAFEWVRKCIDPCLIEAATGAGKSHIVADLAARIHQLSGKRILCTAPSKELVEQNTEKYLATGAKASIFSASISKCLRHPVVFGTPLSVLNSIHRFDDYAAIIMDEAHGITPTMMKIIDSLRETNRKMRVIGLTATPYRTNEGYIFAKHYEHGLNHESEMSAPFFHTLVYSIGARDLIAQGYLTPPKIGAHVDGYDTSGLILKSNGKFDEGTVEQAFVGRGRLTSQIVADIVANAQDRQGVLIFAATVAHAHEIMESLPPHLSDIVTGKTSSGERADTIRRFKEKKIKYLVNVSVLTTGFDAPHVDVIAVMRATESPGLLQQIIGRGSRLSTGKDDFLLLDYAENIERHFPHGDVFEPVIKVRKPSEDSNAIKAVCPLCSYYNYFNGRPNPDGFAISLTGYFVDLAGNELETPAHFGRRCDGEILINGEHQRCGYKWTFKNCPKCQAENDIAARYCGACGEEIVDPNEKLRELATQVQNDPYRTRTSRVTDMQLIRHPSRNEGKPDTIRIIYTLDDYSKQISQWLSPNSHSDYARKQWARFSTSAFGMALDMDSALTCEPIVPELLVYRKQRGSKYFEVINQIWKTEEYQQSM